MKIFCLKKRRASDESGFSTDQKNSSKKKPSCLCRVTKWTLIIFVVLIILLFIIIFVVLPLVVCFSLPVQTFLMFPNIDQPSDPQYNNFDLYGARATRNFYVTVNDYDDNDNKVSLGLWHLVPENLINEAETNKKFDYDDSLKKSGYPVVLYFHGNMGTRIINLKTYLVLRKFFHVVAFDYRSYGDSSKAKLSENAVISDNVQLYQWLMQKTDSPIYVWGHSLGTALSTHTVANLKDLGIVPRGLFLEAPFTNMKEEMPNHPIGKVFAWLPWFDITIVEPMQRNGFYFNTKKNILKVDCPIMIMHSEDDHVIPYKLGKTVYEIANTQRNPNTQGTAFYYQFESYLKHDHLEITTDPRIPEYIEKFIKFCEDFYTSINPKARRIMAHLQTPS